MRNWLANLRMRFEAWQFNRRAINVAITRSCGHVEHGKVLPEWIERRQITPCSECVFWDAMKAHKKAQ